MRLYVGWLLLIIGSTAAFLEPQGGVGCVAVAGAILIAAERIASALTRTGE